MRVLIEAVGSFTAASLINAIKNAGHIVIATDSDPKSYGRHLADEFFHAPKANDIDYADYMEKLVTDQNVELVIPTLDDSLLWWAQIKRKLSQQGICVAISDVDTIFKCLDKWTTYCFFEENHIPSPQTSLQQNFSLIKPRFGRGGSGISITTDTVDMDGMISQEVLRGNEYTVDVFCGKDNLPVYIIPRKRLTIKDGKATSAIVEKRDEIESWIHKICSLLKFIGPVNVQCFYNEEQGVKFTEINPRLGGGTALAFAATENWVPLIINTFVLGKEVKPAVPVNYGLQMSRYYSEVYYV